MNPENYRDQLLALLPPGSLWEALRRGPNWRGMLLTCGDTLARVHAAILRLRREADPRSTTELLPEWEASCGLPDGCIPGGGSIQQRRNAVVARLTATGGASPQYYIDVAAKLGFTITVENVSPNVWRIHAPEETVIEMTCNDTCNDALRTWGNEQLECVMNRIKHAHTDLLFAYGE